MTRLAELGLAFGFSLVVVACGGPTVGDITAEQVSITLTASASAPKVAAIGKAKGGLGVARAFVNTSGLKLVACEHDIEPIEVGPTGYDLLSDPPLGEDISTAVTELCAVRFTLIPTPKKQGNIPKGTTLYAEGVDALGAGFSLASQIVPQLSFAADSGVGSFGDQPLLLAVDVSQWFAGLGLEDNGAAQAVPAFEAQFCGASALYVDANDNQLLDDDETTPVAHCAVLK